MERGDNQGARKLLMAVLMREPRCIDAHAHLGHIAVDLEPKLAMMHYEVALGLGEIALGPNFDGYLAWGRIYYRPYLRAM